ncbi:MAG TPA: hypothetical protein VFO07_04705, partial [Roseiflexaceae bacterium]|nr:hypothetical protein [Roseiflexaceae bacterium]
LLVQAGSQERGFEVLSFVQQHTATTHEALERVQRLLEAYSDQLLPDVTDHSRSIDLETLTTRLQATLAVMGETDRVAKGRAWHPQVPGLRPSPKPTLHLRTNMTRGILVQETTAFVKKSANSCKFNSDEKLIY